MALIDIVLRSLLVNFNDYAGLRDTNTILEKYKNLRSTVLWKHGSCDFRSFQQIEFIGR